MASEFLKDSTTEATGNLVPNSMFPFANKSQWGCEVQNKISGTQPTELGSNLSSGSLSIVLSIFDVHITRKGYKSRKLFYLFFAV